MVDDLELCSIDKAVEFFPKREDGFLSAKSLMRRIRAGHRGVRLQAVCDGGKWFTCRQWVNEFLLEVTERSMGSVRSPAASERAAAAAMELLARRHGRRGKKEARAKVSVRR